MKRKSAVRNCLFNRLDSTLRARVRIYFLVAVGGGKLEKGAIATDRLKSLFFPQSPHGIYRTKIRRHLRR